MSGSYAVCQYDLCFRCWNWYLIYFLVLLFNHCRSMALEEATVDAPWVLAAAKTNSGKVSSCHLECISVTNQ